jgi:hypothetical protein
MILEATLSIYASHPVARAAVKLEGFTNAEQEQIRAVLSEIPSACLRYTKTIVADKSLGAKHGRYDGLESGIVHLNPRDFGSRVRFGKGPGRKLPHIDLTLAHELGHGVFLALPTNLQDEWKKLSGWKMGTAEGQSPPYQEKRPGWPKETSDETHKEGAGFPRHYAERNSDEDFADAFGFFVMGQKTRLPENKQAFLAKVLR